MSTRQQPIHASADVVFRLLTDIGGWRIWNRRVDFAEIDGDAREGVRGVLYLRRVPWLPWSLQIEQMIDLQKLTVRASCLSVHVHVCFELSSSKNDDLSEQVVLTGTLHSDSLFGRLANSRLLPLWHGFLSTALAGVCYAAESVSAAQHKIA